MTDTNTGRTPAPPRTERGGTAVLVAVALASLMVPLAVTGPALALTSMAGDLDAGVEGAQWVLHAYNVTFAASLLAAGGVADRIGRRRVLVAGTAVYAAMSLVTAVSTSILVVDLARAVQGIGSAGILTAGAAILAATFEGPARARAFGVLGTAFGAGLALGPLLAGTLVDMAGWRAVFLLNLVVAAVVLTLCPKVPESRTPTTGPVDWGGAATSSTGLFLMALGFVQGPASGWGSPLTVGAFVGAALFVALFVVAEKRAVNPTFDLSLFRRPAFVAVMSQPFTIVFGFVVLVVFLPPYLQGVDGYSASAAGALLLPLMLPVFLLPVLVGRFAARVPLRHLLATSSLLIAAGSTWLLTLEPGTGPIALAGPLLVFGLGVGSAFGVMDNAAVSSVPVEQAASAAGMFNTIRITGESVAVAAAAALLGSVTLAGLRDADLGLDPGQATAVAGRAAQGRIAEAVAGVPAGQQDGVLAAAVGGVTTALHVAFAGIAVLALVGALVTVLLLREATGPAGEDA